MEGKSCFSIFVLTLILISILPKNEVDGRFILDKKITISLPSLQDLASPFKKPTTTPTTTTTTTQEPEEETTAETTTRAPAPTLPPSAYENYDDADPQEEKTEGPAEVPSTTTEVAPENPREGTEDSAPTYSPEEETLATYIIQKLDSIEKKVDELQKSLEKSQSSAVNQAKNLQKIQSNTEEQVSKLQAIIQELSLPGNPLENATSSLPKLPQLGTTTADPFDVDIRSRSFLSKVPGAGGLPSLPSSLPSVPGVPTVLTDLTQKLPALPNPLAGEGESEGSDTNSGNSENPSALDIENYVPDVGLISDDPDLIRFLLFNSKNPEDFQILEYKNLDSIRSSDYDAAKPVKFLIHGFQQNFNSSYPKNVRRAYVSSIEGDDDDLNVIVVDWGLLAIPNAPYIAPVFYPWAVKNIHRAGQRTGEFISWLKNETMIDLDKTHIIGFSLGSHVAGKAGSVVRENHSQAVSRVTALDPAGPEFYTGILARKIQDTDGEYVDAIHTNAGQLGIWQNVGRTDYYVNGGSLQPGCIKFDSVTAVVKTVTGTVSGACSHNYATKLFAQTILDKKNLGSQAGNDGVNDEDLSICACSSGTSYKLGQCKCEIKVMLGAYSAHGTSGTFYLDYKIPN